MASKANRILQSIRDSILIIVSILLMSVSYGKWVEEPVHFILFGFAAFLGFVSLINFLLVIINIESRWYYYLNTLFQTVPLGLLFLLFLSQQGWPGFIFAVPLVLNIAILITLRKKKVSQSS
ncbi:hypothetical protein ACFLZX_00950 [Nanoarchaeota archaeon]